MKTMKTILILVLAVTANIGFAQKNIILHQNTGQDYISHTIAVDSITFEDFTAPGTLVFSTYNPLDSMIKEAHSKVTWESTYKNIGTTLAGGFNVMYADILFDEANPGNIMFDGKVQLSTTNTFEPDRDHYNPSYYYTNKGCVTGNLGVLYDTLMSYTSVWYDAAGDTIPQWTYGDTSMVKNHFYFTPVDSTDWAYISAPTGSVVAFGDGYKAMANFTYKGVTTVEPVYFKYHNGGTLEVIEAEFQFDSADPGRACGSSAKGIIRVKMHLQFKHL